MSTTAPDRAGSGAGTPTGRPGPTGPDTALRGLAGRLGPLRNSPRLVRGLCLATLVANCGIVVTGAAVRLTGSGLGCPTWPSCTDDSYVNSPAYGIHGYVEFGNRMLTFVLAAVIAATVVASAMQYNRRPVLVWLAAGQLLGIVAQAVLGGITVLTGLNPWTVAGHFLLSMVLVYAAYTLFHRSGEGDGPRELLVAAPMVWVARAIAAAAAATIAVGTVVTGSGPHAGDSRAGRTGFDPALISQLHADLVFLLVGLTVAALLGFRAARSPRRLQAALLTLLCVELAQGAIGYVQYFTGLPVVLVGVHILGACVLWVFAVRVLFTTRVRREA